MKISSALNKVFSTRAIFVLMAVCALALQLATTSAQAGEADVVKVTIKKVATGKFRIDATLQHGDTGWDHYANKWEVFDSENNLLGTRVLAHPHVNEQPFTRSLTLQIAATIAEVIIRAGDSVHEAGGKEMTIAVPH